MINRKRLEVKSRMQFYRDNYRRGVTQLVTLLFLIIILVVTIFYELLNQPPRAFYASTIEGTIVKLKALNGPNESSTPLIK